MKLTIQQAVLTHLATIAGRVASNKPVTSIEGLVLLEAGEDDRLSVRATDYKLTAQASGPANVMEPGTAAVSSRLLALVAKVLPKGREVELVADDTLWVRSGKASWQLPLLDADIYPVPPNRGDPVGMVAGPDLSQALDRVVPFAGDPTKRETNGLVQFVTGETLAVVSTDTYRLALAEVPWRPTQPDGRELTTAAVGLALLADTVGSSAVTVSASDGTVTFATDDVAITAPLWERYLPWQALALERDWPSLSLRVQVETAQFAEALTGASVLLSGDGAMLRVMVTPDEVRLAAPDTQGRTDAVQSVPCVAFDVGEQLGEFAMGCNPAYLKAAVAAVRSPRVELSLPAGAPNKPFLVSPVSADGSPELGYRHVCQPMRLPAGSSG